MRLAASAALFFSGFLFGGVAFAAGHHMAVSGPVVLVAGLLLGYSLVKLWERKP